MTNPAATIRVDAAPVHKAVCTVRTFMDRIVPEWCRPGDGVGYDYGHDDLTGTLIERSQRRMLRDLRGTRTLWHWAHALTDAQISKAASVVHWGCVYSRFSSVEMTSPRARMIDWTERLRPGDRLVIRRPVVRVGDRVYDIDAATGAAIAEGLHMDAVGGLDYPERKILMYYLYSWGIAKLTFGRKVETHFRRKAVHVCSARYWQRCLDAPVDWAFRSDADPERIPAIHYPAELTVSPRLRTVCEVRIVC